MAGQGEFVQTVKMGWWTCDPISRSDSDGWHKQCAWSKADIWEVSALRQQTNIDADSSLTVEGNFEENCVDIRK